MLALGLVGCGQLYSVGSYDTGPVPDAGYQRRADKIDILFVVDNSLSMGTKQDLLHSTIPDFLDRLLVPDCVNEDGTLTAPRVNGMSCPPGFVDRVKPVTDLHVGVITSSLGGGGGDMCDPTAHIDKAEAPTLTNFLRHNDDRGHLINRKKPDPLNPPPSGMEDPVPGALPASFLAWLPNGGPPPPVQAYSDRKRLYADFGDLVSGAQEFGCGLEAQLEAFYRFLIQPDPWDRIEMDDSKSPAAATLVGVDPIILQQRKDFLRPDSALAVIVVTDEEDSWSDPMWLSGRGWLTRSKVTKYSTTGQLPRGSSACSKPVDANNPTMTGPNDPNCFWCAVPANDPNCNLPNLGLYSPTEDGLNVRYSNDMKRRYGMNPQFPIERYVDGLTSDMVPDRKGEHMVNDMLMPYYQGHKNCVNPLFAKNLPTDPTGELCNLVPGPRNASLVFFGIIGGVPWQLLTDEPRKGGKFKSSLDDDDWRRILGKDPSTYQDEGIDPHMLESIQPRAGIACGTVALDTCDPFHGREYDTKTTAIGIDFQYACTFELPQPKDCTKLPEGASCDCGGMNKYSGPLCAPNPNDSGNPTLQIRGKAYPTIRQLRVAQKLGDHAVVGSICPRSVDVQDPDFGYRPALRALVDHMRVALQPPDTDAGAR